MSTPQTIRHTSPTETANEDLGDGLDLLTAGELALLLRVTPAWVYAQTRAQRIPHVSLGRYRRYRRSAVLGWIEELEARG